MHTPRIAHIALFVAALGLAACGGNDGAPTDNTVDTAQQTALPEPEAPPAPEPVPVYDGPAFEITMTPAGNEMLFEQTDFTVRPGQTVRLTFNNTATNPAMSHNVVFLHQNVNVNDYGRAAMAASATDYIPRARMNEVIAHTAMAAPGETVSVEFTAPAAGEYTYVCTYPGHYMMMRGTMRVVAEGV